MAFHVSAAGTAAGGAKQLTEWWGADVDLTFRFLDADGELTAITSAGLHLESRTDREPAGPEHPSRRCYLLLRKEQEDQRSEAL